MKKFGFWGVFIIIFFAANATVFAYSEKPEYQLLASFAAGYANNKDMNDSADKDVKYIRNAINNYYTTYYGTIYPSKIESSTKANTPVGFDLEFRYFSNNIGFGLQVGYHSAKAESKLTGSFPENDKVTGTYDLSVVPVVGTIYYRVDFESSNSFVLLGGGLGFYYGKIDANLKHTDAPSGTLYDLSLKGSQIKIGAHILAEYDYVFGFGLTLFGGVKARYVQFDEFKKGNVAVGNHDGF